MTTTRIMMRRLAGSAAALAVAAGCWGCDGGDGATAAPSTREEAKVTGTVTIRGKPATGGQVAFDPSNINRRDAPINTAEIGPNGSYAVTTLIGANAVRIVGPQVDADPSLATNQVDVDVPPGESTIPIEVE